MKISLEMDAFSDGQIGSKLWACRALENLAAAHEIREPTVWILGGWVGVLPFLLLARERLRPKLVVSFDMDESACSAAELVNKNWELDGRRFRAVRFDCQDASLWSRDFGPPADIIINTACEHFLEDSWIEAVPSGKWLLLQSTDQPHDEEVRLSSSLSDLEDRYSRHLDIKISDQLEFVYPTRRFQRFMLAGKKR